MNSSIEHLYQSIGQRALSVAPALAGRLLVYSEVESGVASADIFYVEAESDVIRFRFAPSSMLEEICLLWEEWKKDHENREWRVMCYVIDDGKFSIDLIYPDQLVPGETLSDRRPQAVRRYFGEVKVDYSKP